MSKVKLNIRGLGVTELVAKARHIAVSLTGNPKFTNSQAIVTQINAAADAAETGHADAQTARQISLTKTNIARDLAEALEGVLRQAAGYIESVAGDDESTILSAGVNIRTPPPAHSTGHTIAPTGLSASPGDHEGEIHLTWDRVENARSYAIERSPDPLTATSWAHEAVSAKTSATISGLSSGTRYWFRVAAVTSAGQSGWSNPVIEMTP